MTTKGMQDMERRMVDQSTARKDEGRHPVDSRLLDKHAEKNGLSDEQTKALHHMSGKDGVSLVEGMAGTGKSTMMKAAHSAWKEAGYEVRGAALAGKAADGLEEGSGIKSQPKPFPTLHLVPAGSIFDYQLENVQFIGYQHHPAIRGEVAV